MKILFYGGCHAAVLKRIFEQWAGGLHAYELLTNYEMIAAGSPFPYDHVSSFDVIIFSPITNKDEYNTENLVQFCREKRIDTVSFPWLQWNGYFPSAEKRNLFSRNYWYIPASMSIDNNSKSLVLDKMAITTERLIEHERSCNTDVRVSAFIAEYYKEVPLFLTPDHPTNILYRFVAREISKRLEIPLKHDFFRYSPPFQPEIELPITQFVADALQLKFQSPVYKLQVDHLQFSLIEAEYGDFSRYTDADLAIFSARRTTKVWRSLETVDDDIKDIEACESFIGAIVGKDENREVYSVRVISGRHSALASGTHLKIAKIDWEVFS
ncbi:hypothetical protein [Pararhizobium qamdonense]|uniref:hypothetical protein n=1 Tax=Pararhizobium qamdonense TaxID=3031126 RepID=UPI0023E160EC|nr:hypothetical protein [Pararhizobium qamdonense]